MDIFKLTLKNKTLHKIEFVFVHCLLEKASKRTARQQQQLQYLAKCKRIWAAPARYHRLPSGISIHLLSAAAYCSSARVTANFANACTREQHPRCWQWVVHRLHALTAAIMGRHQFNEFWYQFPLAVSYISDAYWASQSEVPVSISNPRYFDWP